MRKAALLTTFGLLVSTLFVASTAGAQTSQRSKSAYNVTQARNAESVDARSGDIIEYTLRYENTSGLTQTVTVEDSLSDVLLLADLSDYGGATLNGTLLRFPSVTLSPGNSVTKTFRVRVKSVTAQSDLTMSNFYGNGVDIRVRASGTDNNLGRSKSAQNLTQRVNAESTTARAGDQIEYRLRFFNDSSSSRTVTIEDDITDVMRHAEMVRLSHNGQWLGTSVRWPDVIVGGYQTAERTFEVRIRDLRDRNDLQNDNVMINSYGNEVRVRVDNFSASVLGSTTGRSKSAYNRTQGQNAEYIFARPGDSIDYTLSYFNNTGSTQTVTIEDDLTDVLDLAFLVNNGGGTLNGNILRFPSMTVSPNSRVDRTFQVQIKDVSANKADLMMSNSYGNGVDIRILPSGAVLPPGGVPPKGQVLGVATAPPTGPAENYALLFALLFTGGLLIYNKRNKMVQVWSQIRQ